MRLWNVARTRSEIQAARSTELTGTEAGLVAYWRFNAGLGTSRRTIRRRITPRRCSGTAWVADGPLAPDTTAPQIANIVGDQSDASGATITFTTSEAATGWVSYVAGTACPCTDVYSAGDGTTHTRHADRARRRTRSISSWCRRRDAANNQRTAAAQTSRRWCSRPTRSRRRWRSSSPAAGTVSGSVAIDATATDNVGVVSVEFKLDGVSLGAPDTTAPYTLLVGHDHGGRWGAHADGRSARRREQRRHGVGGGAWCRTRRW